MNTSASHIQPLPGRHVGASYDNDAPLTTAAAFPALPTGAVTVSLTRSDALVPVVTLPNGYGLLPITLSVAQVALWTGLGRTKLHELINTGAIVIAKVDGRTLVLTASVLALIERSCRARAA